MSLTHTLGEAAHKGIGIQEPFSKDPKDGPERMWRRDKLRPRKDLKRNSGTLGPGSGKDHRQYELPERTKHR